MMCCTSTPPFFEIRLRSYYAIVTFPLRQWVSQRATRMVHVYESRKNSRLFSHCSAASRLSRRAFSNHCSTNLLPQPSELTRAKPTRSRRSRPTRMVLVLNTMPAKTSPHSRHHCRGQLQNTKNNSVLQHLVIPIHHVIMPSSNGYSLAGAWF